MSTITEVKINPPIAPANDIKFCIISPTIPLIFETKFDESISGTLIYLSKYDSSFIAMLKVNLL